MKCPQKSFNKKQSWAGTVIFGTGDTGSEGSLNSGNRFQNRFRPAAHSQCPQPLHVSGSLARGGCMSFPNCSVTLEPAPASLYPCLPPSAFVASRVGRELAPESVLIKVILYASMVPTDSPGLARNQYYVLVLVPP